MLYRHYKRRTESHDNLNPILGVLHTNGALCEGGFIEITFIFPKGQIKGLAARLRQKLLIMFKTGIHHALFLLIIHRVSVT